MFYSITGDLVFCGQNQCAVECAGVAFAMTCSDQTAGAFARKKGEKVTAYTYLAVREDALDLFGFSSLREKELFIRLIGVDGVGPKAAISILSALSCEDLVLSVLSGDAKSIASAKGIGLKTAQKVILELKDKVQSQGNAQNAAAQAAPSAPAGEKSEAVNALVVLGYAPKDAAAAVQRVAGQAKNLQDLIRLALKSMGDR